MRLIPASNSSRVRNGNVNASSTPRPSEWFKSDLDFNQRSTRVVLPKYYDIFTGA